VTLVERKTRFTILLRLPGDHSAQSVGDALIRIFTRLPAGLCRTLTWDQGNEMFHHRRIEVATGLKIYFCDPHSPWQRGTNENTNGLLRQYFPKGTDLSVWTSDHLDHVAAELNDRPRECLRDQSPHQIMQQWEHRLIATIIRNDH
jgi:IS30 family transposase